MPMRWLLGFALMLPVLGCGSAPVFPVRGQVLYQDGKPVTGAQIEVERIAEELKERVNYRAELDGTGRFAAEMREGEYQVLVMPILEAKGTVEGSAFTPPFPRRYMSYATSELKFAVSRDAKKNDVVLKIDRP